MAALRVPSASKRTMMSSGVFSNRRSIVQAPNRPPTSVPPPSTVKIQLVVYAVNGANYERTPYTRGAVSLRHSQ